jgi:hypothetical protein
MKALPLAKAVAGHLPRQKGRRRSLDSVATGEFRSSQLASSRNLKRISGMPSKDPFLGNRPRFGAALLRLTKLSNPAVPALSSRACADASLRAAARA